MKRILGLLASVTFAAIAAMAADAPKERHLEEVKWTLDTHKLTAVVSEGRVAGPQETKPGEYVPERLLDYVIDLKAGTVTLDKDVVRFSRYEGELIWRLVDLVVKYAGESVLWFDDQNQDKKPKQEAKR